MGSDTVNDAELRRLFARTCAELLAKDIQCTMAVPVIRDVGDLRRNPAHTVQRLWVLPGLWNGILPGMVFPLYLSDTAELARRGSITLTTANAAYEIFCYQVYDLETEHISGVLRRIMELRESHGLES